MARYQKICIIMVGIVDMSSLKKIAKLFVAMEMIVNNSLITYASNICLSLFQLNMFYILIISTLVCIVHSKTVANIQVVILHTSNVNAMFAGVDEFGNPNYDTVKGPAYGGFARLRYYVKQEREKAKKAGTHVLLLNTGNTFTGSAYSHLFGEKIVSEMMNLMGFDVVVS